MKTTKDRRSWKRFKENKPALIGLFVIGFITIIAIGGPFLRPDSSIHANSQNLGISKMKPGFEVDVVVVPNNNYRQKGFFRSLLDYGYQSEYIEIPFDSVRMHPTPQYLPYAESSWKDFSDDQLDFLLESGFKTPQELREGGLIKKKKFRLGTDRYGRDLLSRLMAGTIISLSVGFIAVFISLLVGISLGALAGYFGGWIDSLVMWLINVIWSIPTLLLVMAIVFAFGKGFEKVFIAVGLTMWVEVARIVRGQILSIREKEFVEASRALGFGHARIIFGHILPNILGPVIVISAANFAAAILIEAGLSFLGIGAQIPTPSWGNMIKEHYSFITTDLAYLAYLPGLLIMLIVLAFMLVGNGLRDANDVKAMS